METGIVIGRHPETGKVLRWRSDEHAIVQAKPGAGKSSTVAIPTAFDFPGSMVILDVKLEIFAATSGWRAKSGHEVFLFNPAAEDGRSHRWNPFFAVDRQAPTRFWAVRKMAQQLFPETQESGEGNTNFWNAAARDGFIAAALMIAEMPEEPLTIARILRIFNRGDAGQWMAEQIEQRRRERRPFSQAVVDGVAGFRSREGDRLGLSIVTNITTALQLWNDPKIIAATSETDFDISQLRRRRMSVFVGVAPSEIEALAPLLRLFLDAVLQHNSSATPAQDATLTVPVCMLLDEFAAIGRVDRLVRGLALARAYNLRFVLLVHSRAQLMATYGTNFASMAFDNVGLEAVLSTGDHVLAKQLEERLGDATVSVLTRTAPRYFPWFNPAKQSLAEHPHRRPVMLAAEIMQMPQDELLILRPGMPGAVVGKLRWWEEREFADKVRPVVDVPRLQVLVALDDGADLAPTRRQVAIA
jgi:type IV secretion system protein VirD4